jgi:hypothetical protein
MQLHDIQADDREGTQRFYQSDDLLVTKPARFRVADAGA